MGLCHPVALWYHYDATVSFWRRTNPSINQKRKEKRRPCRKNKWKHMMSFFFVFGRSFFVVDAGLIDGRQPLEERRLKRCWRDECSWLMSHLQVNNDSFQKNHDSFGKVDVTKILPDKFSPNSGRIFPSTNLCRKLMWRVFMNSSQKGKKEKGRGNQRYRVAKMCRMP